MVSAASEVAAASAAAGPSSSSSDASPPWKQLQQRAAPAGRSTPTPSSKKLRTMPSRHTELGSDDSSFSPTPATDGSLSAGDTRSSCLSNSLFSRDFAGAPGDGSICPAAAAAALISSQPNETTVQGFTGCGCGGGGDRGHRRSPHA
ncbi:Os03g0162400 [Oryza sativa Japonica Group]|uniref:Os03g0162400 protein n=2 Tax=Oryza sativa subsp. japonica TaxID=39947 RepID=Q0DUX3_ORYSJ|nr:hypothetical protein EE612_015474 [Oryza sativa]BAF10965.1 Os03g0162400 [Oryza sativa Japonica Group]BAS82429.1 Os03g0162400 [Oryza sativa Japonica Group]|eukprot:NP_001049051.1 Os03g0162400 [Oryza sativa Japonica Group]